MPLLTGMRDQPFLQHFRITFLGQDLTTWPNGSNAIEIHPLVTYNEFIVPRFEKI